jgi:hypothetical protein
MWVSPDWKDLGTPAGDLAAKSKSYSSRKDPATETVSVLAVNAINGSESYNHLPVYTSYMPGLPYRGKLDVQNGILIDFMGFRIPQKLYCSKAYMGQTPAHDLRLRQCSIHEQYKQMKRESGLESTDQGPTVQMQWPVISEEYFEYADVLSAAADFADLTKHIDGKPRDFAVVELGCGYGHWTFAAHRALMQKAPQASYRYLMVDVVSELVPEIKNLASLNGAKMTDDPDSPIHVHVGYVGANGDKKKDKNNMTYDERRKKRQIDDYILKGNLWGLTPSKGNRTIPSVSLKQLLELYNMPCELDIVDVDIQGAEYSLFDRETVALLSARAHRLHIGTHQHQESWNRPIEKRFNAAGWDTQWFFVGPRPQKNIEMTKLGPVQFNDGVLSFVNKNPIRC